MAFCSNCGAKLSGNEKFCGDCSYPVGQAAPEQAQQATAPAPKLCVKCGEPLGEGEKFCGECAHPVGQPAPVQAAQPPITSAQSAPPKKKKSKKPLIIGGATGVVALTLVVVLIFNNFFGLFDNIGGNSNGGNNGNGGGIDLGIDVGGPIDEDGRDWSKYDWTKFDPADLLVDIGKASFTIDNGTTAAGEYIPGEPLTLSVTDSAGAKWTLEIPSNGLLGEQAITMTALRDITTNGIFETLTGGVLLEPDGLQFFAPANLTVSGGGYGEHSVMLTGNHDGGNLDIPYYETNASSATMYLNHFSTAAGTNNTWYEDYIKAYRESEEGKAEEAARNYKDPNDPWAESEKEQEDNESDDRDYDKKKERNPYDQLDDPEKESSKQDELLKFLEELNKKKMTKAQKAAVELLKQPNFPLGIEPPAIWFDSCPVNTDISAFLKDFNKPEQPIILQLCNDMSKQGNDFKQKYKSPDDIKDAEKALEEMIPFISNFVLICALYERLGEKANFLIEEYKYKPEKFYAVAWASSLFNVLFGIGKVNQGEIDKWWRETWNYQMNKLVADHDYHRIHALWPITFTGALAGAKTDGWKEKLGNALTFRMEWEYKDALGTAYVYYLSGEAVVSMYYFNEEGFFGMDAGVGHGDRFEGAAGDVLTGINPPSFSNIVWLSNLDPCIRGTITVGIDDFGKDVEFTLFDERFADWPSGGYSTDSIQMLELLEDKLVEGFYTLEFSIINLQEKCVDDKYEVNLYDSFMCEVTIRLIHTPKEDVYISLR